MLISLLFKENGPENSVILYDDPTAIGRRGQPCHLTALKKQTETGRKCEGVCSFSISRGCFISTPPSTNPPLQLPPSWQPAAYDVAGSSRDTPLEGSLRLIGMFLSVMRN